MKSMLHEASTVTKALAKAWDEAGQPREFTVRVLEEGERNFFGFSKRPAIVSITYEPKKQAIKQAEKREKVGITVKQNQIKIRPEKRSDLNAQHPQQIRKEFRTADRIQPVQQVEKPRFDGIKDEVAGQQQEEIWTQDLISDVKENFVLLIEKIGIAHSYNFKADRRMLSIIFDQNLMESPEDERQLFVGLSYLLMQFLKKKHKKKFRGYHLVLSTKNHATSDK